MATSTPHTDDLFRASDELRNLREIAEQIVPQPGDIPELGGIDIYGKTMPLNGVGGGDHVIYIDFKKRYDLDARIRRATERNQPSIVENLERCRRMAGVAVIDVSDHQVTDVMVAAMMHQSFLLGSLYELDSFVISLNGSSRTSTPGSTIPRASASSLRCSTASVLHDVSAHRHAPFPQRHRPQCNRKHTGVQGTVRVERVDANGHGRHPALVHRWRYRARDRSNRPATGR